MIIADRGWVRWLVWVPLALMSPGIVSGQDDAGKLGSQYIPINGFVAGELNPAKVIQIPNMQMLPIEVADAWCQTNVGFPISQVENVRVVAAVPGPGIPLIAGIVQFKTAFDIQNLHPQITDGQPVDVDGHQCVRADGPVPIVIHQLDARTIVVAPETHLSGVLRAQDPPSSPLSKLAEAVPAGEHLTLLIAIEPIRLMANGFIQSQADQIPPPLKPFTKVPDLLDAVLVKLDFSNDVDGAELHLLATSDETAQELSSLIAQGLEMGRELAIQQMQQEIGDPEDPVQQATAKYIQRISNTIVAACTPKRQGRRLTLTTSAQGGIATQGILVSLLLPAVQAARTAARRTQSANNLRQIGLAMHNFYATHDHLPEPAIRSADGKPLLSWRVQLLPFLGQQELYQQFHLDEPWDSAHNAKLIEQIPDVYQHPAALTLPGHTVYQVMVGEKAIFEVKGPARFRDILDGLSNTVMAIEARSDLAVPWTKPQDFDADAADPLLNVHEETPDGFNVLMADGAVNFITFTIDKKVFDALLTRAGFETINEW